MGNGMNILTSLQNVNKKENYQDIMRLCFLPWAGCSKLD